MMQISPQRPWRLIAAAALTAVALFVGCSADGNTTDRQQDTTPDLPPATQRPSSTGAPQDPTTSLVDPADGGLEDGDGTMNPIPGAQPGRPQLDGEPTADPIG